jgi:hypothetical protein
MDSNHLSLQDETAGSVKESFQTVDPTVSVVTDPGCCHAEAGFDFSVLARLFNRHSAVE